ncbi:hypothetical protein R1flu_013687 [Riccia fluitans]|uniref:C2H2-type domain-containing protein n=1 Tax=Riccia fluitans TaxID=41844 RepID=A0ABD1YE99_9MARC
MEEANETRCQGTADNVETTNVVGREAARQTILPFANRPIHEKEDVNYREMGVPTPKNELGHRVMKEYHFKFCDGEPIATCRHCGVEYVVNIIRLRTHFTGDHDPQGKQQIRLPKRGSQKHVKVCACYSVKAAIISLHQANLANQREFMQDIEYQSMNAGSDNEDVFLQREFSQTIHGRNLPHARTNGIDPPLSQPSAHALPLSVANTLANLSRQAFHFQTPHPRGDGNNMTKDAKWVSGHILNAIKAVDPKNVL